MPPTLKKKRIRTTKIRLAKSKIRSYLSEPSVTWILVRQVIPINIFYLSKEISVTAFLTLCSVWSPQKFKVSPQVTVPQVWPSCHDAVMCHNKVPCKCKYGSQQRNIFARAVGYFTILCANSQSAQRLIQDLIYLTLRCFMKSILIISTNGLGNHSSIGWW